MGRIAVVLALVVAVASSGCSWMAVQPPSEAYEPVAAEREPRCTRWPLAPAFDVLVAGVGGVLFAASIPKDSVNRSALAGSGAAMMTAGVGASFYGFRHSAECRQLSRRYRASSDDGTSKAQQETARTAETTRSAESGGSQVSDSESGKRPSSSNGRVGAGREGTHISVTWSVLDAVEGPAALAYSSGESGTSEVVRGPMWEFMAEWHPSRQVGLAIVGGAGSAELENPGKYGGSGPRGSDVSVTRIRYGIQGMWYPVGDVEHGMQLGGVFQHERAVGANEIDVLSEEMRSSAGPPVSRFVLSPIVGYKVVTFTGFTLNVQGGLGVELLQGGGLFDGAIGYGAGPKVIGHPYVNLNLGWTL